MVDYISRKAAVDAICQDWCNRDYCGDCHFYGAKQAIAVLKTLPDAEVQHWIPCGERLPSDYVLFCDLDGDVYYGHRMDNKWWAEGCDDRIKNVIAWMPLPEPYKAKSEEV